MRHAPSVSPRAAGLWTALFGNTHPVCVEIGPGRGEFLLHSARGDPKRNFFAVERSRSRARALEAKIKAAKLRNARVLAADAGCLIELLPEASVSAYVIQFPDPWWKRRHRPRRVVTEALVAALARTLVPGGTIDLVTDVAEYFHLCQSLLDAHGMLERFEPTPSSQTATTSFGRKAATRQSQIWTSTHHRRN